MRTTIPYLIGILSMLESSDKELLKATKHDGGNLALIKEFTLALVVHALKDRVPLRINQRNKALQIRTVRVRVC